MYRRTLVGLDCDSKFFDQNNKEALKTRENCAFLAINDMLKYFESIKFLNKILLAKFYSLINNYFSDGGDIGIIDGTNTRIERRRNIETYLQANMRKKFKLIWIESICNLSSIIENNIFKTKVNSPDYKSWNDPDRAVEDFRNRILEYEKIYEKCSLENLGENSAFIQIINQGEKMIVRNLKGYIESKIISYLTNLHTQDRPIYFIRHGESEDDKSNLIGGDSCLTPLGQKYAKCVSYFMKDDIKNYAEKPVIYCSTLKKTIQTAEKLSCLNYFIAEKLLDEINAGMRDGLSYEEFKLKFPEENKDRNFDKLNYRYLRGESYMDVISRIEPIIFELERIRSPVIIISHQGVLRCLYGYFAGVPIEIIPNLEIPMNTIIKFVPDAYGFFEVRYSIDAEKEIITKDDKNFVKFPDNLIHIPE